MVSRPLKLISSMATRDVLTVLASQFERSSGLSLSYEAAGGVEVDKRVRSGEAVDVVVLAGEAIDTLMAQGRLLAGSRIDLVKSGIAVAVKAGAPRSDITSEEAMRSAVLAARTVCISTGPSGAHLRKIFRQWRIYPSIAPRMVVAPPGTAVGSLVATGVAELGFQQSSELKNVAGIEVIGMLPAAIQSVTTFSGAIAATCDSSDAARELLSYLASPAAAAITRQFGMESAAPRRLEPSEGRFVELHGGCLSGFDDG